MGVEVGHGRPIRRTTGQVWFPAARGIIHDDESRSLPGPFTQVLYAEKSSGFFGGEKTTLPFLRQVLQEFEGKPRFARAAGSDYCCNCDSGFTAEPISEEFQVFVASDERNCLKCGVENIDLGSKLAPDARFNGNQLEMRQTDSDMDVIALSLDDDVVMPELRCCLRAHVRRPQA